MDFKPVLEGFDAALLVHPDWYFHRPDGFCDHVYRPLFNFKLLQDYCTASDFPLFSSFSTTSFQLRERISKSLEISAHDVQHPYVMSGVEEVIGKNAQDIRLLVGGFKSGACVDGWLATYCAEHDSSTFRPEIICPETVWTGPQFAYGRICDELTDYVPVHLR